MKTSIKDIARAAGVSHSTVSRALSDSPLVNEVTRARIHRLALEMGYSPDAGARSLVKGDWEGWGDVRLDVAGAHIQVRGEVAWLATYATVSTTIGAADNFQSYLQRIKEVIDQTGPSAEEKLLDILRGGSNTLYELRRGEQFVWPLRFTAVLVRQADGWRFQQMQFSFPTTRFPDERIVI